MAEYVLRFILGGVAVSLFAILGDIFRPKSFAGLFAAAPSVALGTLAMTIAREGGQAASTQGYSMILGGIALCAYSLVVVWLMQRSKLSVLVSTVCALPVWFGVAFGLLYMANPP